MSSNYRKVNIPKLDWSEPFEVSEGPKISKEVAGELKRQFDEFAVNKKVNPHLIQNGLRSINFHKEHPDIYKVIEDLCLEYDISGREISSEQFVKFINDHLGDNASRQGLTLLFNAIANQKEGVITPNEIHQITQELGDDLSKDDIQYIMEGIAEPSKDYNINLDEFYYIMTKKPIDVVKITKITKNI